ncbi:hypothetical protein MPH_02197 [Macrophomina phaseolina MS6]|uniref:Lysophospholipase n=2 Tax=Macrophomina phaseolina TaxID=35725 RepID=K2SDK0_MACPH|nr:hypothetical protein MPH_02197 [Macrophomina phaseolina MS6]KAH7042101.1 lysophospholipase [Macrophomina phaseolina]
MAPSLHLGALSLVFSTALAASAYAPVNATCPTTGIIRSAEGLNSDETAYISSRKAVAQEALLSWLTKTNSAYTSVNSSNLPTLALTTSGGGYRSMLVGAGVVQGFDSRDSNISTSGLYQALTYQAGLSGGSWLLSSLAGNDWPTVSSLRDGLWSTGLQQTLFLSDTSDGSVDIVADLADKEAAGFDVTLTDPWGRLLSYQFLYGDNGGVNKTFSGVAANSQYTSHSVPFPIITALGVKTWEGDCEPAADGTQYEFTPYEFGSWDTGVAAFTPTQYLGSHYSNGAATAEGCVTGFDNLGFVLGTSSSLFNQVCIPANVNSTELGQQLADFVLQLHALATQDLFAAYPNPFYNYEAASLVAARDTLDLVDGGLSDQNNPLWPLLHRAAEIDVLLVNDNSADTDDNWPNGTEIYNTYLQAQAQGVAGLPVIPDPDTFVAEGLNQRATFFGCNDTDALTVVFVPNYNFTYDSNVATLQLQYSAEETSSMIANGAQVADQGGDAQWAGCLACGIMAKSGETLPDECTACLEKYCYN